MDEQEQEELKERKEKVKCIRCVLAWWPSELPSSDDVQVKVVDGLAPSRAVVNGDPEPLAEVLLLRDHLCRVKQVAKHLLVGLVCLGEPG